MSEPGAFAAPSVSYIEDGTYLRDIARAEAVCFSEPWSEKAVEEFLSQPYNHVLVALAGGVFAGFITYTRIADEIQIANVAVLPEYRRRGVGRRMMELFLVRCRGKGAKRVGPGTAIYPCNVGMGEAFFRNGGICFFNGVGFHVGISPLYKLA